MKKTEFLNTRKKIEQKNHGMIDKVTTLDQAVNLINNGDTIALGGCLYSRTPIAMIRGKHRRRFLLIAAQNVSVQSVISTWLGNTQWSNKIRVTIDVDPYNFM